MKSIVYGLQMEMKSIVYGLLLLTAAVVSHFELFRPPTAWAWPVVMIGLGLAWGYTVRPRREVVK